MYDHLNKSVHMFYGLANRNFDDAELRDGHTFMSETFAKQYKGKIIAPKSVIHWNEEAIDDAETYLEKHALEREDFIHDFVMVNGTVSMGQLLKNVQSLKSKIKSISGIKICYKILVNVDHNVPFNKTYHWSVEQTYDLSSDTMAVLTLNCDYNTFIED